VILVGYIRFKVEHYLPSNAQSLKEALEAQRIKTLRRPYESNVASDFERLALQRFTILIRLRYNRQSQSDEADADIYQNYSTSH
jgi:hypothetical protein